MGPHPWKAANFWQCVAGTTGAKIVALTSRGFHTPPLQDYFPEHLGCMFIINAPLMFRAVWSFVKPFLDERTLAKIQVGASVTPHCHLAGHKWLCSPNPIFSMHIHPIIRPLQRCPLVTAPGRTDVADHTKGSMLFSKTLEASPPLIRLAGAGHRLSIPFAGRHNP